MKDQKFICPLCQKEFKEQKKLNYHLGWHKGCEKFNIIKNKEVNIKTSYSFICKNCNKKFFKEFTKTGYKNYLKKAPYFYCSRSCSSKRNFSKETKQKISNSLIDYYVCSHSHVKERECKICGKKYFLTKQYKLDFNATKCFCSLKCKQYYKLHYKDLISNKAKKSWQETGRKLVSYFKEIRRSKNEIAFYELCQNKFSNVIHNETMFNGWDADIILLDLKIAVLWNGKWHYEKITKKHSVSQVQNRDKIKINEIKKCGYYPYIIKDLGKFSMKKVNEEFEKFCNFIKINCGM